MAALVAAAVLGGVGGTVLRGIFGPPMSRGWEPREVVTAFYRGINDLNFELVEGVTADKAGKNRATQVLNLFTTSRIRLGYEGASPYVNAEDWLARGDPDLQPGEILYGIADLALEELGENRFRATYQEWNTLFQEDGENGGAEPGRLIRGRQITEEILLEWRRKAWLIVEIRVTESRDIKGHL